MTAQLLLLPSLNDANTTVVWEAMSHAVPTLCLDHCGMHDTIKDGSGIKIPITDYERIVKDISVSLEKLIQRSELLKQMAEQLLVDRQEYMWNNRSKQFEAFYSLAEEQFKKRHKE